MTIYPLYAYFTETLCWMDKQLPTLLHFPLHLGKPDDLRACLACFGWAGLFPCPGVVGRAKLSFLFWNQKHRKEDV